MAKKTVTTDIKDVKGLLTANNVTVYNFDSNISFDGCLAQMYYGEFEDNATGECEVQRLDGSFYVLYGSDAKPSDSHYTVSELDKLDQTELLELAETNGLYHIDDSFTNDEIIDELLMISHEDYYENYWQETMWYDVESDIYISGYSQGDAVKFITVGKVPKYITDDYLHHIFFDAPISGTITIEGNGELVREIYLDELLDSIYEWDKDTAIERVVAAYKDEEYIALLGEWLENTLPDNLEYH